MNNSVGKRVAFIGVMFALIFVLLMLETFVFIGFIKPSSCFLTIPIAIALSIYADRKMMFLGGTLLGMSSIILAVIIAYTPFYNPLVSVVPRVLMGVVAFYTYRGVKSLTEKSSNDFLKTVLPAAIAGAAGALFNTVTVITMMQVFGHNEGAFVTALSIVIAFNSVLELAASIVLVPVLVKTLQIVDKKQIRE